ncbi:MAG: amino acid ABC transporter substrate-binding protein [Prochlorococcaceae cyanobacterium]
MNRALWAPWRRALMALALAASAAAGLAGCAANESAGVSSPRLAAIRSRGSLLCGINGQLPGFSILAANGRYEGLDADLCRAVAAAVLGDAAKVEFRLLTTTQRFAALASGEVDLLARNTSVSLGRDAPGGNALSFAPVVLHDHTAVMVPKAGGITALAGLAGQPICVISGTSTEVVLADRLRERRIAYVPLRFHTADQAFDAYLSQRCAAIVSDQVGLAGRRSTFPDPLGHRFLPDRLSKEQIAVVTAQADPAWADAVRWLVYGLIEAEEQGVDQASLARKLAAARAEPRLTDQRRLLGLEGHLGSQLGLSDDFLVRAIGAVGNYGEIFERHLGSASRLRLQRGPNRLARDGGLLVSPSFR